MSEDNKTLFEKELTPENRDKLIAENVRERSVEIVEHAIAKVAYLWNGLAELPERTRIVEILKKSLKEIESCS